MKIGYIRVSTQEQNTIRQEVLMEQLGVDQVYIDKASGKNTSRPELQNLLAFVRKGDTVIVESISGLPATPGSSGSGGTTHRQGRGVRLPERGH